MNNQELFDAIAFAYQSCHTGSSEQYASGAHRAMLVQLKELLAVQLDRAKK